MENIVKDLPHDALRKKYVEAVSLVASLTSKLASVSASERLLQVLLHQNAHDMHCHSCTRLNDRTTVLFLLWLLSGDCHYYHYHSASKPAQGAGE